MIEYEIPVRVFMKIKPKLDGYIFYRRPSWGTIILKVAMYKHYVEDILRTIKNHIKIQAL